MNRRACLRTTYDDIAHDLHILARRIELVANVLPEPLYPKQPQPISICLPTRSDVLHTARVMGTLFEDRKPWQVATEMRVGSVKVEWFWHDTEMCNAAAVPDPVDECEHCDRDVVTVVDGINLCSGHADALDMAELLSGGDES